MHPTWGGGTPIFKGAGCSSEILKLMPKVKETNLGMAEAFLDT